MKKGVLTLLSILATTFSFGSTVTIHVFNFEFGTTPPVASDPIIEVGDTVHWVWDASFHTATSLVGQVETWDSGLLNTGATFDHTFTNVGSFGYVCDLHGFDFGNGTFTGMGGYVHVANTVAPFDTSIFRGILIGGTVADVASSNDQYLTVQKGLTANQTEAPIQVNFFATSPTQAPKVMALHVEDGVNAVGLSKRVQILNVQTGLFEQIDQSVAQQADKATQYVLTGDLSRFVAAADRKVTVRLSYFATGPVTLNSWQARFDRVVVLVN